MRTDSFHLLCNCSLELSIVYSAARKQNGGQRMPRIDSLYFLRIRLSELRMTCVTSRALCALSKHKCVTHHVHSIRCMCVTSSSQDKLLLPLNTNCQWMPRAPFHRTGIIAGKWGKREPIRSRKEFLKEVVTIVPPMTISEIALTTKRDYDKVCRALLHSVDKAKLGGVRLTPETEIEDIRLIKACVELLGYRWKIGAKQKVKKDSKDAVRRGTPDPDVLVKQPPVVTIMGHVDHGKTTLLDSLRKSNIVDREFGGITQHIGAFSVTLPATGETITFLDTPGHAAFSAMRSRGAHCTDIVVLVVAADDGVMQQTVESLSYARDADVPIIVAINKCDKPEADVEMTKRNLMEHSLISEDLGGDTQIVPISALKGTNLAALQEAILAQAELSELWCDPTGLVEGVIIESSVDPGRGKVATVLVQRGSLKKGAVIVAGTAHAKVRSMYDDMGKPVNEVKPGMAAEIIGWKTLPSAGELLLQVETEQRAKEVLHWRKQQLNSEKISAEQEAIQEKADKLTEEYRRVRKHYMDMGLKYARRHDPLSGRKKEVVGEHSGPEVAVVIKGDVDGSVEAILDALDTYTSEQCRLHLLSFGVGDVTEQDIEMASTFKGEIYAFNVKSSEKINNSAKAKDVTIHHHNVIYKMLDDIRDNLEMRLPPEEYDSIIGEAEVKQIFMINEGNHKIPVAGSLCTKGFLKKNKLFKLIRDDDIIIDGPVSTLKHLKSDVNSIKADMECGVAFMERQVLPMPGDNLICYEKKKQKQKLDWDLYF